MVFRVDTSRGALLGESDGPARVWRAIPYAAPPTGERRWRRPEPARPWSGIRDASRFGAACPQVRPRSGGGVAPSFPRDEDCLTLNVWAPADASDGPYPVVVWVHGGAFVAGASCLDDFNGSALAALGAVVVTVNYRLGAFGFVDLSWASATGAERAGPVFDANSALWDVVEALRWVRDEIACFDGDPACVTLMGESAGGTLVTSLLAAPPARGLIHRAVALSPAVAAVYSAARMRRYAQRLLGLVGADVDRPGTWRDVPADALVAAAWTLLEEVDEHDTGTIAFAPVTDGDLLPEPPVDAALGGRTAPVPLLVGTTRNEALLFVRARPKILPVDVDRMDRVLDSLARQGGRPGDSVAFRDVLAAAYPGYPARSALLDLAADSTFRIPTTRFADGHSRVAPVWMYRYDFATPSERMARLDATHGTEIPLVFDTLDAPVGRLIVMLGGRAAAERLGARIRAHLVAFARTGRPEFGWPRYEPSGRTVLVLDRELRIARDPDGRRRQAWDGIEFLR
ncbi:carboxylesterase/lipase family protein [Luteimicrobium subarcticum]|uniref:Para-nitrobenzyl esterase n=1 Tax=Luteimicrobium subarcticum TaxID=620910 RepID=A0A2M8W3H0_9MICO|nr:carboxylesterase family protein [Luteimicrobium subarcticum]PJI85476.1 para-nitrobenzyl esterase [Luteimicrobium subarcticum]